MTAIARPRSRSVAARGFTLVEVLVSMVILSAISLGLTAALRTFAQTEVRVDERVLRHDDARVAGSFLRAVLERMAAKREQALTGSGPRLVFAGGTDELVWIGVMPARHGLGGLHYLRLARPLGTGALTIQFLPYDGLDRVPDWSQAAARAVAEQVDTFAVRYRDDRADPPVWTPVWPHANRLPDRVALTVQANGHAWPEIVIAPRVSSASVTGRGRFTVGGD